MAVPIYVPGARFRAGTDEVLLTRLVTQWGAYGAPSHALVCLARAETRTFHGEATLEAITRECVLAGWTTARVRLTGGGAARLEQPQEGM